LAKGKKMTEKVSSSEDCDEQPGIVLATSGNAGLEKIAKRIERSLSGETHPKHEALTIVPKEQDVRSDILKQISPEDNFESYSKQALMAAAAAPVEKPAEAPKKPEQQKPAQEKP